MCATWKYLYRITCFQYLLLFCNCRKYACVIRRKLCHVGWPWLCNYVCEVIPHLSLFLFIVMLERWRFLSTVDRLMVSRQNGSVLGTFQIVMGSITFNQTNVNITPPNLSPRIWISSPKKTQFSSIKAIFYKNFVMFILVVWIVIMIKIMVVIAMSKITMSV